MLWVLTRDGAVDYLNSKARTMGSGAAFSEGQLWKALWPEGASFTIDRAIAAAAAGEVFRFRTHVSCGMGRRQYVETVVSPIREGAQGRIVRLLAAAREVTGEVETAAFLNSIVQLLPLALTVRDLETGRYVLANHAAEEMYGLGEDGFVDQRPDEILPAAMARQVIALDEQVVGSGRARLSADQLVADARGSARRLVETKVATYDDNGPRHLITLAEDASRRSADGEALQSALAAAQQAHRAKSVFLANVSHELRTPLNAIMGAAQLLSSSQRPEDADELLTMIHSATSHLDRRLRTILSLADLEGGDAHVRAEPYDIDEIVSRLLAGAAVQASEKGIALDTSACRAPRLLGDGERIAQILEQLLDNAVKFTSAGSVSVDTHWSDGRLRVRVADTGIGISTSSVERLFARFHQEEDGAARRFEGFGVGLALCRDLAHLMGATIEAAVRPGGGSIFTLEVAAPVVALSSEPEQLLGEDAPPLRILVADDHPANRRVLELMLSEVARVTCVSDGREAVEAWASEAFDLILMDIQMPGMDGLTAVKLIREAEAGGPQRVPIIVLTANGNSDSIDQARLAGADRYVAKPFTGAVLLNAIMELGAAAPPPAALQVG